METKKTYWSDGEKKMTTISQEEENYVRMSLLLSGICTRAVRALFDSEFDPKCLNASIKRAYNELKNLRDNRIINQSQWNLLFHSRGGLDSNMLDVSLMITLLTNLTELKQCDKLPLVTDTTSSADLWRIKHYRNQIAHIKDGKIDNTLISTAWEDITEAVGRLGGKHMLDECKELRTKILEQSTVPWNIRVQISQILEAWKMNNSNFVETRAAKHVLKCIQENSCVTITATSGVGKTATLQYVALVMDDEGYDVLPVTNAHDIVNFYNPNQKTLFVMDDFCGTYSINQFDLHSMESDMQRLKVLLQNKLTKIIVACRLQVFQDHKFGFMSIFRTCVCNLMSEDLCLSKTEKQSIAVLYLDTDSTEIIPFCDLYDCFPLLCKLYSDNPELNITDFFKNPFSVYEAEIDMLLKKENYKKYCALALCVMFNNGLREEWLTHEIDTVIKKKIENTCEASRLDRGTPRLVLLDELKSLEYTFIKEKQGIYKTIHDKIFDFLVYYFGKRMIQCFIRNADSEIVGQRVLLENIDDMNQFMIVVPPEYHQMYMQRLIDDWSINRIQGLSQNINMRIPEFRQRLLHYLKTLDIPLQRQLAQTYDIANNDTVLLQCCQWGDIPLIQWCIYHGVEVNKCNSDGISPMYVSAQEGNTNIIKLLLENKGDIDRRRDNGATPLSIACQQNRIETVKVLLKNKADINICMDNEASPFLTACQNNYMEIVKILLDNKADVNKCMDNGESALCMACLTNHVDIVKVLLENGADVNKCTDNGQSPLYRACQANQIEIVKLLIDYMADIDKSTDNGATPLLVACANNDLKVVNLLLDNKADINRCLHDGLSPLIVACLNQNADIVKVLVDNMADINQCTYCGRSPLCIASEKNGIEVVKVLLANKADINKCDDDGASPLFIACQMNYLELVKFLLENKPDINKCMNTEASPLFIAVQEKHTEVVKCLLDHKADINKCVDTGESPLHVACKNNDIVLVNILLSNKADANSCKKSGASPLFTVCQENFF
ncbi:unnamed protein product [Mytilus coruscus]|uniref:Uncharacterized protein n=1 Tax=Mytilus coruscus TaxID=42192 RepID=A0A6J8E748_MYTCO|nr:unnamed protein product [Mytilus coruscus]